MEAVDPGVPLARLAIKLLLLVAVPLVENGGDLGDPLGVVGEV